MTINDINIQDLKGSEKQIAFAIKIRKELLNKYIEDYNNELEDADNNEKDEYVLQAKKRINILCGSSASEIIARYMQKAF